MPNNGISETNTNKNSKPRTKPVGLVVLTYSVSPNLEKTLIALNNNGASVHYIIEENGKQNQFTNDATDTTFCCGKSEFRGQSSLNEISINMMLINDAQNVFKQEQITKLIEFLQDLAQRYPSLDLKKDIAGLGEVALQKDQPSPRHIAPGKFFPWEQLAEQGFGLFKQTSPEEKAEILVSPDSPELKILDLQKNLQQYGYAIESSGIYDDATKAWVTRFNQRYVPDATQAIDAGIWSKASQISLEYILNYINAKTNIVTQSPNSPSNFFINQTNAPAASTEELSVRALNLN